MECFTGSQWRKPGDGQLVSDGGSMQPPGGVSRLVHRFGIAGGLRLCVARLGAEVSLVTSAATRFMEAVFRIGVKLGWRYVMKERPRQRSMDSNTDRESDERRDESRQRRAAGQAPLKKHGQPAWRKVQED